MPSERRSPDAKGHDDDLAGREPVRRGHALGGASHRDSRGQGLELWNPRLAHGGQRSLAAGERRQGGVLEHVGQVALLAVDGASARHEGDGLGVVDVGGVVGLADRLPDAHAWPGQLGGRVVGEVAGAQEMPAVVGRFSCWVALDECPVLAGRLDDAGVVVAELLERIVDPLAVLDHALRGDHLVVGLRGHRRHGPGALRKQQVGELRGQQQTPEHVRDLLLDDRRGIDANAIHLEGVAEDVELRLSTVDFVGDRGKFVLGATRGDRVKGPSIARFAWAGWDAVEHEAHHAMIHGSLPSRFAGVYDGQMDYKYNAKLVRVVDGDTVYLSVDLGFRVEMVLDVRLAGLNAPEIVGASQSQGLATKKELERLLSLGPLTVFTTKAEKYGRWLATITVSPPNATPINVNEWLLSHGLAKPYDGTGPKP